MIFFKRDKEVDHIECKFEIDRLKFDLEGSRTNCRYNEVELSYQKNLYKEFHALYEKKMANYELLREENVTLRNMLDLKHGKEEG